MLRLPLILNVSLGLACLGLLILLINMKTVIGTNISQTRALERAVDEEVARQGALEAEWARLQQRSHLINLGQAVFGERLSQLPQETRASELPPHPYLATGHSRALELFAMAAGQVSASANPLTEEDFIGARIREFEGGN